MFARAPGGGCGANERCEGITPPDAKNLEVGTTPLEFCYIWLA